VATDRTSDWSLAAVPTWRNSIVTVRVSWRRDALIVRARSNEEPWQLVRVAPWDEHESVLAGPYVAAPTRPGLKVRLTGWHADTADAALH
jgi:regulation of enolase protein 1 (concanavalin A-like superfamily)